MRLNRLVPFVLVLFLLVACGADDSTSDAPSSTASILREEAFVQEGVAGVDAQDGFYYGSWFKATQKDQGVTIEMFVFREDGTAVYKRGLWKADGWHGMEGTYYVKGGIIDLTLEDGISPEEDGTVASSSGMETVHLSLQVAPGEDQSLLITVLSGELPGADYKYGEAVAFYTADLMDEKAEALLGASTAP